MLELAQLESGYGDTKVIHGLDLAVRPGTVHALLGRNGVGKSTTLKTIMGLLRTSAGTIAFNGMAIANKPTYDIAKAGIAYVPETRDIFRSLSVRENLELAARLAGAKNDWPLDRVLTFFPSLKARLTNGGQQLSGGEQQMLAIARALMAAPQLILLDEPTEGLAPIIIAQIGEKLKELKSSGLTIVLVEQNISFALALADDVSILSRGAQVWHGEPDQLRQDRRILTQWLGM